MAAETARSSFGRRQKERVREEFLKLVQGMLQGNGTADNVATALAWCLERVRDHKCMDTNSSEVKRDFSGLLEKLRVHSQLDAAAYLEEQFNSFMTCELRRQFTVEPHAAILRALLLLACSPTQVPGRVVRMLRGIYESRKKREQQQQRQAGEQAQDRKILMELELQQVADNACEEWEEAWSIADLVMDETVSPRTAGSGSVSEASSEGLSDREQPWPEEILPEPSADDVALRGSDHGRLPLPHQPWQDALQEERFLLEKYFRGEDQEYLMALPLSEETLLQIATQMLCGFYGEMVGPDSEGTLRWRPLHLPGLGLGPEALEAPLKQLADFGSLLQELRSASALLETVAVPPPFAPRPLVESLAQGLKDGTVSDLTGLVRIWDLWRSGFLSQEPDRPEPVNAFGLCWQSMGLMLAEFLSRFVEELQHFEASAPDPAMPRTLMRLLQLTEPWSEAADAVRNIFDTVLQAVHRRQKDSSAMLTSLMAEELLSALSCCVSSQSLHCLRPEAFREGVLRDLVSELWCGAARPLLRASEQWGSLGDLGELGASEFLSEEGLPSLLPPAVAGAGRSVAALRAWSEARGASREL
ncbi:unnamed protein product [Symbiodinium necroappetens]|uniref:Uncharacterized protein n=1 Tax=Symbiodinium necroappetens TaxID=1628268 RepID=A0A813BQ71_9DINO|nr:unnamed protein product [Symbiodinium necroappetens]